MSKLPNNKIREENTLLRQQVQDMQKQIQQTETKQDILKKLKVICACCGKLVFATDSKPTPIEQGKSIPLCLSCYAELEEGKCFYELCKTSKFK